jgi:hypothetical protein
MAYQFANGLFQYLSIASAPATGTPMTIAAWGKSSSSFGQAMVSIGDNSTTHRNQIQFGSTVTLLMARAVAIGATATGQAAGTSTSSNGLWNHACGVFTSTTSRTIFFNGVSEGTNTTNVGTQNAATAITIGARTASNVVGLPFNGDLADVGIWNVALTDAEIASLAKGMACDKVRPQSLVFYAPLARNLIDVRGGLAITNNNTATVANHPRIYQ